MGQAQAPFLRFPPQETKSDPENIVVRTALTHAYRPQSANSVRRAFLAIERTNGSGLNASNFAEGFLMRNPFLKSLLNMSFLSFLLSIVACSHTTPFFSGKLPARAVSPADPANIESSIFLIGDAGEPMAAEPALLSLTRQLRIAPEKSIAIFLGDNIYPAGLPKPASPTRAEMERRLMQQLCVIKSSGARGIFVPGNHDWDKYGPDGWNAVRRQEIFVKKFLDTQNAAQHNSFLPSDGCPGPEVVDIRDSLRLIVLDTQWWLHKGDKPKHPYSTCAAHSSEEVVTQIQKAIAGAGARAVLIVAHHPLDTHGIHGGFYDWREHLFPGLNVSKYLWVPLPGIGSLYPLVRSLGVSDQDLAGGENKKMRQAIEKALHPNPPLAYISGHERSLQILTHAGMPSHLIVSGHGSRLHTTPVTDGKNTLFAHQHPGFVKLDFLGSGEVRLGVIEPRAQGQEDAEVFAMWLRDRPAIDPPLALPAGTGSHLDKSQHPVVSLGSGEDCGDWLQRTQRPPHAGPGS